MKLGSKDSWPTAGSLNFGTKPAVSGCLLALNAPRFTRMADPNGNTNVSGVNTTVIKGAVVVLDGSEKYVRRLSSESGESVPMRVGGFKGAPNLRGQSAKNAYYVEKSNTTLKD